MGLGEGKTGEASRAVRMVRSACRILLNAVVAAVALNAALALYYQVQDSGWFRQMGSNPLLERYPSAAPTVESLFPAMSAEELDTLFWESYGRTLTPHLYTGFGETPFHGKYVNVSEYGFRTGSGQGPWPPVRDGRLVVFLFGGSQTFGYGVTDGQALGSRLQPLLEKNLGQQVSVYNFGQGCYFSTQERLLFEKLLVSGRVPDIAIFVDGLTDFQTRGKDVACSWEQPHSIGASPAGWRPWVREGIRSLPMARLARAVRAGLTSSGKGHAITARAAGAANYDEQGPLRTTIDRYFRNKQMIEADAREFSVRTLFVWQPVSTYGYELDHHVFTGPMFEQHLYSRYGYPLMRDRVIQTRPSHFLWCADIQAGLHEELYVDADHYSPKMTEMVAGCIAEGIPRR